MRKGKDADSAILLLLMHDAFGYCRQRLLSPITPHYATLFAMASLMLRDYADGTPLLPPLRIRRHAAALSGC
jgi:hypothetical protein